MEQDRKEEAVQPTNHQFSAWLASRSTQVWTKRLPNLEWAWDYPQERKQKHRKWLSTSCFSSGVKWSRKYWKPNYLGEDYKSRLHSEKIKICRVQLVWRDLSGTVKVTRQIWKVNSGKLEFAPCAGAEGAELKKSLEVTHTPASVKKSSLRKFVWLFFFFLYPRETAVSGKCALRHASAEYNNVFPHFSVKTFVVLFSTFRCRKKWTMDITCGMGFLVLLGTGLSCILDSFFVLRFTTFHP